MENVSLVDGHIDNGISDADIIKALECCKKAKLNQDCLDLKCPFSTEYGCNIDDEDLRNKALDLINRQKAEIERLEFSNEHWNDWEVKCRAIKEFAERLKEKAETKQINYSYRDIIEIRDIDNLVKEMIGEQNE